MHHSLNSYMRDPCPKQEKESSKIDNVEEFLILCSKCFQGPPPSSLLTHPLPTCPQFFANPRCAPISLLANKRTCIWEAYNCEWGEGGFNMEFQRIW